MHFENFPDNIDELLSAGQQWPFGWGVPRHWGRVEGEEGWLLDRNNSEHQQDILYVLSHGLCHVLGRPDFHLDQTRLIELFYLWEFLIFNKINSVLGLNIDC